jgi:hypothetical protein
MDGGGRFQAGEGVQHGRWGMIGGVRLSATEDVGQCTISGRQGPGPRAASVITYLLEDEQELSLGMLDTSQTYL